MKPLQRILLFCGILSSVWYVATDIVGGLQYPGYDFASQAISELGAIGAPSKRIVDPLFTLYNLLALAFGVGVVLASRGNRRLRTSGALLIAYGAVPLGAFLIAGADTMAMHQRGTSNVGNDLPHILLTAAIVLVMLGAMGIGGYALGKRFRNYSVATIIAVVGLSAVMAPFASRLAAGLPTPGFGIAERIEVYALLAWIGVLSIALLRREARAATVTVTSANIGGAVAAGFEEVRAAFLANFAQRGEIGAAVAAYWHGQKVVDLWGGRRAPDSDAPWVENTMTVVHSSTKGLAAMTLAIAHARGWLDYDKAVADYWPEFGQNGKSRVTVRQLLGHEAGLVLFDEALTIDKVRDLDYMAQLLARQKPAWQPGTRHGYHTMSIGLYMQELIRRVDPEHRTLGRFFHEEIALPLGIDFYIGLPHDIPASRLATMTLMSRWGALKAVRSAPPILVRKLLEPNSLLRRSMLLDVDPNDRRYLEAEVPAGNGVGTARAIARAYSAFAEGGAELGITPETFAQITAPPLVRDPTDAVIGMPSYFSLGFMRPGPEVGFGFSPRAFGSFGAGGSLGFGDPDAHIGYAYIMNKTDYYLVDDPREKALRDALYRALARATPPEKWEYSVQGSSSRPRAPAYSPIP